MRFACTSCSPETISRVRSRPWRNVTGSRCQSVARDARGAAEEWDVEAALTSAQSFFVERLKGGPRKYLEERQIPDELIETAGIGYAPDSWTSLVDSLTPEIPQGALMAAGLVGRSQKSGKPYDRFRHRLMFPIHAASGRLLGFGGRTLGDDKAKYINTAETRQFSKGYLLYALDRARRTIRGQGQGLSRGGLLRRDRCGSRRHRLGGR